MSKRQLTWRWKSKCLVNKCLLGHSGTRGEMCLCVCVCVSVHAHLVMFNSLRPHGLQPARFLGPWNFPGKNSGIGCHFLLQGIFLTQRSNLHLSCLLHWQAGSSPVVAPGKHYGILTNRLCCVLPYLHTVHTTVIYGDSLLPGIGPLSTCFK